MTKRFRLFLILAAACPAGAARADMMSAEAVASGNWSNPATWLDGVVPNNGTPNSGDTWSVVIDNGRSVVNNVNATIDRLKLGAGGGPSILGNGVQNINVVDLFEWEQGALGPAGFAEFTMLPGSMANLTTSNLKQLRQNLTNQGMMTLYEGNMSANNPGVRLTNDDGGIFTMVGGRTLLLNNGRFRNQMGATFNSLAAAPGEEPPPIVVVNQIQWVFDSEPGSTVNIQTPTQFNGGGSHQGDYTLADGITLDFGGIGTQHDFKPASLTTPELRMTNSGSTLNIQEFGSQAVLAFTEFDAAGGLTNFNRDVLINDAEISGAATINANGQATFDGQAAIQGAQLGGAGGFVLDSTSQVQIGGGNVVDAPVVQKGFVAVQPDGKVFFAPNGSWVITDGARFQLGSFAEIRSTGLPTGVSALIVDNGGLVVADTLSPEHDISMEFLSNPNIPAPLTGGSFAALTSPGDDGGLPAAISAPGAATLDIKRGRLTIEEGIEGRFDIILHSDGTFLLLNQPTLDAASRLLGNGRAARVTGGEALEWNAVIDPEALDSGAPTLTVAGDLNLTETAELRLSLGAISDLLTVEGALTLDGSLVLLAADGFGPGIYPLIDFAGALTDHGLILAGAPEGFTYRLRQDDGVLSVEVAPIPEPSALLLMGALGGFITARRRARRMN